MPSIRNVAIIAHVDHGKTTLVDGLLKQAGTFRENEAAMQASLIMDANDQERERGITILAKTTAVQYKDTTINIIDTPGHADFGGEVERTLGMADGALLIVDAQEGPMPQTTFVLKKALALGLAMVVVINKVDKKDARVQEVVTLVQDLLLDLATDDSQLDMPVYYAIGRDGKAWAEEPTDSTADATLEPIFEAILKHVPAPTGDPAAPLQIMVSNLEADAYQGRLSIGRVLEGTVKSGMSVVVLQENGSVSARVEQVLVSKGLKRAQVEFAEAGDIVALSGLKMAHIGDTIADPANPVALPRIIVEEPTLKMAFQANTSPFAGREGTYVTGRQLLERIERELETNVSMKMTRGEMGEYVVAGRGELHLAVFIENLRREGYELEVGKPQVVTKEIDGVISEPVEELTVTVTTEYVGPVTGEVGRRRGVLLSQKDQADGSSTLRFEVSTRGLIGLRSQLLTLSRGTAQLSSLLLRYQQVGAGIPRSRNGVLLASEAGKAVANGLEVAQNRGITFIPPQTEVYEGMVVGLNNREDDLEINVCREKKQTNVRASSADISVQLTPPTNLSLEQCLDFLEDDELLEATPTSLRLRKRILNASARSKARKS